MEYIKICSVAVAGIVLISLLPAKEKSINSITSISISIAIVLYILSVILPYIESIKTILQVENGQDFSLIFKIVGISILSQFVCDFSTDNGNKTLSSAVSLASKIAISFLAMPIYIKVFEIIGQLIK